MNLNEQLKNLRRYHKETDHKFLHRLVCCVCGTYFIDKNPKKYENDLKILIDNRVILSRETLSDKDFVKPFVYTNPDLFDLVLDKDGIKEETNKVKLTRLSEILKIFYNLL